MNILEGLWIVSNVNLSYLELLVLSVFLHSL